MYRISPFIGHFAWALLAGAALATLWVNLDPGSYFDAIEWRLFDANLPAWVAQNSQSVTPIILVDFVLMPLFVFFLGKELWEALVLDRGAFKGMKAGFPLVIVAGGMVGAVALWLICAGLFETAEEASFGTGWVMPLGSEVVIGYLIGRALFGPAHPALHMLLLVTIAMDITALLFGGLAFPEHGLTLFWLVLPVAAACGVWVFAGRKATRGPRESDRRAALHLWPYIVAGVISWAGVAAAGLPPALGLLPIIPAIPHADHAFGMFAQAEEFLTDPLNRLAHLMVWPLVPTLFLFGLTHGGAELAAFGPTTFVTLGALWLGKPLGMALAGFVIAPLLGMRLPAGLGRRHYALIAVITGIGFTAPLLALPGALPGGEMQEAARLGLAFSLLAGPVIIVLGRQILRPRRA